MPRRGDSKGFGAKLRTRRTKEPVSAPLGMLAPNGPGERQMKARMRQLAAAAKKDVSSKDMGPLAAWGSERPNRFKTEVKVAAFVASSASGESRAGSKESSEEQSD
eukprot:symbB.v1.2.022651.t1/scaffold2004.1/size154144/6